MSPGVGCVRRGGTQKQQGRAREREKGGNTTGAGFGGVNACACRMTAAVRDQEGSVECRRNSPQLSPPWRRYRTSSRRLCCRSRSASDLGRDASLAVSTKARAVIIVLRNAPWKEDLVRPATTESALIRSGSMCASSSTRVLLSEAAKANTMKRHIVNSPPNACRLIFPTCARSAI